MALVFPGANGDGQPVETKVASIEAVDYQAAIDATVQSLGWVDKELAAVKARVDQFEIVTDEDSADLARLLTTAAQLRKKIEAFRKDRIVKPKAYVDSVNAFVKKFRDQIDALTKTGKSKIGMHSHKQELKRREDEKRAREAQAKAQAELNKAADKSGVDRVTLPDAVATPKKADPIRSEQGSVSTSFKMAHRIIDPAKVPREYLIIDEKKIKAAVKAGVRKIAGVEIFEESNVRVRTT